MSIELYQGSIKNKNIFNSSDFFLLKDSYNINQIEKDSNIDLTKIKEFDFSLNRNGKNIYNENKSKNELNSKEYFANDSFYRRILSTKEKLNEFINIHKNINFNMLQNEDKSNSSLFFNYKVINILKNDKELKEIELNLNTQMNSIFDYKKENISIISNQFKFDGMDNEYKYYRRIKPNGNSFYISFIYQYFKYLIKNNNESTLSYIFNIEKELSLFNCNNITPINNSLCIGQNYIKESINPEFDNLKNAYFYLYMIYKKTIDKQEEEALNIFDYSFLYEESFNELLCIYMRLRIKRFIEINKDIFTYEKYCLKYKLIKEKYYDGEEKAFIYEKYIKENVGINKMEPSLFIISIIPYVFKVNLNLYIYELSSNSGIENNCYCNKISLNEGHTMVNILYTSFSYHLIEKEKNNNSYKDSQDLSNIFNITNASNLINLKNNYIIEIKKDDKTQCKKCHCTKFIKLININKNEICSNCLIKTIEEIFEQRYSYLINEEFNYIEYYLRDIPLIYSQKYNNYTNLNSAEFYFLFNCNIFTYFRGIIRKLCDVCGKSNKLIHKTCGCKICIECAKKEIGNKIILSEFEKNYIFKNEKMKCKCGKELEENYRNELWNLLNKEKKSEIEIDSNNRNQNYIKICCMLCGDIMNNKYNPEEEKHFSKYYLINNIGEKKEHLICINCFEKIDKKKSSIFCLICQENHYKDNENNDNINIIKDKEVNMKNNIINDDYNKKINEDIINENRKKSKNRIKQIKIDDIDNESGITRLKNSLNSNNKQKILKVETKGKICKFCIIF